MGTSHSQGWEEGVKGPGLAPPALLSPNLGGEDSLPGSGPCGPVPPTPPPPPPASGTAGDLGQPDAPSGILLGQARAHTPLSSLAHPLPSLFLDRPLVLSLSTDSLRVLRSLSPALKHPPLSDAPNSALLLDGGTVAASAGSLLSPLRLQPSPLPRYGSGALDSRPSPLSPRTAIRPW